MNQKTFERAVEMARALKPTKKTGKSFHVSILYRKNRMVCVGINNYNKSHNEKKFGKYLNHKGFANEYRPSLHSESSCLLRFGEEDLSKYDILNIRIGNENQLLMSKPCPNCFRILQDVNIDNIFYSTDKHTYEQIKLKQK